jgi:hypothetical protein
LLGAIVNVRIRRYLSGEGKKCGAEKKEIKLGKNKKMSALLNEKVHVSIK